MHDQIDMGKMSGEYIGKSMRNAMKSRWYSKEKNGYYE